MTNAVIIRIDGETIEQLINGGALRVEGLTGAATVRRMWTDQQEGVAGTMHVVVDGDDLPEVKSWHSHMQYVLCKAASARVESEVNEDAVLAISLRDCCEPLDKKVSCC